MLIITKATQRNILVTLKRGGLTSRRHFPRNPALSGTRQHRAAALAMLTLHCELAYEHREPRAGGFLSFAVLRLKGSEQDVFGFVSGTALDPKTMVWVWPDDPMDDDARIPFADVRAEVEGSR